MTSIEEKVEDFFKIQLKENGVKYFSKTESINPTIDEALKNYMSKSGGKGNNYPDIRVLIEDSKGRMIPVMIEAKGTKGDLVKFDKNGDIELITKSKDGNESFKTIQKYAVNGAVHYAKAILSSKKYREVISIGINGYEDGNSLHTEIGVYYVSIDNYLVPKKIGDYSDLKFLKKDNIDELIKRINNLCLSDDEILELTKKVENNLDGKLREINQVLEDTHQINVNHRVNLISGMIIAGLGIPGKIVPLSSYDLKGQQGKKDHDGMIIYNKIESFLGEKNIPQEKQELILGILRQCFIDSEALYIPKNGESKIKSIYKMVEEDILPIFEESNLHLDFTGKLFNVLNDWVSVPDGGKNDVVLTPRYVTDLMAKLARVNKDSFVLDTATGSSGFLVSSMKLMIEDCKSIVDKKERDEKINHIKLNQLMGIEKLPDIYMLAVLNMILMGDGSSNILRNDSLLDFSEKYTYKFGPQKDQEFPANVFLLNPPYSAEGKGFIFVEKAFKSMKSGYGVILIQENSGSGNGLPYTEQILKNNTLLASIHMSDIFCGKASVQTAIYVFKVARPHEEDDIVKFIDFSNDGYLRQNRKKSSQEVNLKNTDHAVERYEEIVSIVNGKKSKTSYYTKENGLYIEDTISLKGNDWAFSQHVKMETKPTLKDFKKTVSDYLAWEVSNLLKNNNDEDCLGK